jgi:hypothetical protein
VCWGRLKPVAPQPLAFRLLSRFLRPSGDHELATPGSLHRPHSEPRVGLYLLREPRFVDLASAEVYASLLDQGAVLVIGREH